MRRKKKQIVDKGTENFLKGSGLIAGHPMFSPLYSHASIIRHEKQIHAEKGWAFVSNNGYIYVNPAKTASPEEWTYILAHCLLHLAFGHFQEKEKPFEWNIACDCFIAKFLSDLKFGKAPEEMRYRMDFPGRSEEKLYEIFSFKGIEEHLQIFGTAGEGVRDMIFEEPLNRWGGPVDWQGSFAEGLSMAVESAVNVAAGLEPYLGSGKKEYTAAKRAREWFINSYPLLGALASSFEIIEDPLLCHRMEISVGAVDEEVKEIYMNRSAGLSEEECRFVMAHELLHVGLRHTSRRQGRDPYLWNVACDYVINSWLVEMGLGNIPKVGALYDPELKGISAESLYDRIVTDMRRYRKLATLRGVGLCDILERGSSPAGREVTDLDEFYRQCLSQGLTYHEQCGRGYLPGGLIEDIKALSYPAIPWDVELARWFDNYFAPLEHRRSYARQSRRQSSTPDIPRPRWVHFEDSDEGRTFGVILDTSGSMDRNLLGKALGAIASYSISRDVPLVRVLFCDTVVYDQGYMSPEVIADRVKVKGRGGTILQPAVDLLEKAEDFPKKGPFLIITDGECDVLRIHREHAILIPQGRPLPFVPKGQVFRIK